MKLKHSYGCQLRDFNWLHSFLLVREKLKVITELNMICIFRKGRNVLRSAIKMKYIFFSMSLISLLISLRKRVLWLIHKAPLPFPESITENHLCFGEIRS